MVSKFFVAEMLAKTETVIVTICNSHYFSLKKVVTLRTSIFLNSQFYRVDERSSDSYISRDDFFP